MTPEKPLTVIIRQTALASQRQADKDLETIDSALTFGYVDAAYFHRLRRRVTEKPELADKIQVVYQREDGKQFVVGLRFEDEPKWPLGFCSEMWDEECKIQKERQRLRRTALSSVASLSTKDAATEE